MACPDLIMAEKSEGAKGTLRNYRLFQTGILVLLVLCLRKSLANAVFTLYALAAIFYSDGFGVLSNTVRIAWLNNLSFKYASFSWTSIASVIVIIVIWQASKKFLINLTAQFILPVLITSDRMKAIERLSMFISGRHGAAVFIKEGNLIERKNDLGGKIETVKPGVILVDLSSAVILSQEEDTQAWNLVDSQEDDFDGLTRRISVHKGTKNKDPFVEVKGPGLAFTKKGQKIFNVVDLRPQSRSIPVEAYTRDGIKLATKVSVGFSLSDKPETIPIGFVEREREIELQWLDIEKSQDSRKITVKGSFDLEDQDKQELLDYFNNTSSGSFAPEEPEGTNPITPYKFYPNRVFGAAYSKARRTNTGEFVPWFDAPLEIAVDIFRKELLSVPYDSLYNGLEFQQRDSDSAKEQLKHSVALLKKLREEFGRRVKLKGIVHFQFYIRKRGEPFRVGDTIGQELISQHPAIALSQYNFNSLRRIGVVIKSASFSELQPVNPDIKKRMIDNWKTKWEKEVQFINAEYELEAVRVRNRNRAQIQQEMTYLLAGIFQNSHTDEALALRVFQALESAATNPTANSDISPKEIVSMLDSLHKWLLIDRKDALEEPYSLDLKTSKDRS